MGSRAAALRGAIDLMEICVGQLPYPGSIADSLFSGLGVKCFSNFLIEGVAFAFGREPFVFRLNIGFAFL
jgi:hypothetical protein